MSNKPQLSAFFQSKEAPTSNSVFCDIKQTPMSVDQYSDYKGVKGGDMIDNDRSICQMIRNANKSSGFTSHPKMVLILSFANNAVYRLGQLNGRPGQRWTKSSKRSDFTEEKRQVALGYLNDPHHPIFSLIKEVFDESTDPATIDYIVEVAYYMERVNNKILQYESEI